MKDETNVPFQGDKKRESILSKRDKTEEIKRAKHFRNQMKSETNNIHKLFWKGRLVEVMDFCNLTEEDLK